MRAKLAAVAQSTARFTLIAPGEEKDVLQRILAGEDVGTLFALERL